MIENNIDTIKKPTSENIYNNYVTKSIPVLIKGYFIELKNL
jgi:hypothetical protein